jgi:hypothetical protein
MKTWITDLLKKILSNGFLLLLIISVLYILYLRECKRPEPCPGKDEILVPLSVWNKIQELANKPAKHDTIWIKGDIVYVPTTPNNPLPLPKPEPKDSTINNYSDSLVNKEIDVHYDFKVNGTLIFRSWSYRPIIERITDSVPYPVVVDNSYPVKTPQNGLYISGIAGGNKSSFIFGGGLDYITKKETEIGYMYQRFGNEGFHLVKFGGKLFKKRK